MSEPGRTEAVVCTRDRSVVAPAVLVTITRIYALAVEEIAGISSVSGGVIGYSNGALFQAGHN